MPKKVEKTRAGNTKTEKGYMTHIVSVLRAGTQRWAPKWHVMNEGRERKINPDTGKECYGNTCNICNGWFFMKDLRADHIDNIGKYLDRTDMTTFEATLGKYTIAMYCEKANLQRACLNCHKIKTKEERKK